MIKCALIIVLAALMVEDIQCCCCVSREPYMTKSCLECLFDICPDFSPPKCGCSCFKDIANPCQSCGSGYGYGYGCGCGKSLYYPEVEYPVTNFNVNPFYYGSCFGY